MQVKYDAETDILMFVLSDGFPENAVAELKGTIVSYDEMGEPISIEFLNASKRKLLNPQNLQFTIVT